MTTVRNSSVLNFSSQVFDFLFLLCMRCKGDGDDIGDGVSCINIRIPYKILYNAGLFFGLCQAT